MFSRRETEVMVVGAGPVGLFAALSLADRGIQIQLLDKGWRGSVHSYALALHGETLRMLDELGVAQDLVATGHKIRTVAIYNGHERVAELSLADAGGTFPFVVVLPQSELENALEYLGLPVGWCRFHDGTDRLDHFLYRLMEFRFGGILRNQLVH